MEGGKGSQSSKGVWNRLNVERDFNQYWRPILKEHGVDYKEVPEYIKVLLHEYLFLQRQALPVYKAVTNGEMDRLSWCSEPIIEKFQELYKLKAE